MPGRTTTFDTWLAYSDDTAAKRAVAGKYGVDFRTPEPSKAHLHAMLFLREAYERRPKMVKFNGEQFDYLENAIHAQMQVDKDVLPEWDQGMTTSPTAQFSAPPPFSSSSTATATPTNPRQRVARVVTTQPELTMTPITPTVSMNPNQTPATNYGMPPSSAGHGQKTTWKVEGEPAPMIMPYGVTFLKGDSTDGVVFLSKTARHGSEAAAAAAAAAAQAWSQETLEQHRRLQQHQYHQQQMQQNFQTHQPSPLTPRNLQHHLHQENQKPACSPTSPRKTSGTKRPSGHSTAPTDMATNPASRQRPRIQVSTSSTPLGFPQGSLSSAGGMSSGSAGSAGGFQLDDARLSKQLASLEVRGESMSPSSTTRTHPPNGLPMPSNVQHTQPQPFVVPSQAHLFPDRSCQDMNSNTWETGNYWTNGIVTDESELTW